MAKKQLFMIISLLLLLGMMSATFFVTLPASTHVVYANDKPSGNGGSWVEKDNPKKDELESLVNQTVESFDGGSGFITDLLLGAVMWLWNGIVWLISKIVSMLLGGVGFNTLFLQKPGSLMVGDIYSFAIREGNVYAVLGAFMYAVFRGIAFLAIPLYVLFLMIKASLLPTPDALKRAKEGVATGVVIILGLAIFPQVFDLILYIRNTLSNGLIDLFYGEKNIDDALMMNATGDLAKGNWEAMFGASLLGLGLAIVKFVLAWDYICMSLALMLCLIAFPIIPILGLGRAKKRLEVWTDMVLSSIITPIVDIIVLAVPFYFNVFYEGGQPIPLLLVMFATLPMRKMLRRLIGVSDNNAESLGMGAKAAALMALGAATRAISRSKGEKDLYKSDIDSAAREEELAKANGEGDISEGERIGQSSIEQDSYQSLNEGVGLSGAEVAESFSMENADGSFVGGMSFENARKRSQGESITDSKLSGNRQENGANDTSLYDEEEVDKPIEQGELASSSAYNDDSMDREPSSEEERGQNAELLSAAQRGASSKSPYQSQTTSASHRTSGAASTNQWEETSKRRRSQSAYQSPEEVLGSDLSLEEKQMALEDLGTDLDASMEDIRQAEIQTREGLEELRSSKGLMEQRYKEQDASLQERKSALNEEKARNNLVIGDSSKGSADAAVAASRNREIDVELAEIEQARTNLASAREAEGGRLLEGMNTLRQAQNTIGEEKERVSFEQGRTRDSISSVKEQRKEAAARTGATFVDNPEIAMQQQRNNDILKRFTNLADFEKSQASFSHMEKAQMYRARALQNKSASNRRLAASIAGGAVGISAGALVSPSTSAMLGAALGLGAGALGDKSARTVEGYNQAVLGERRETLSVAKRISKNLRAGSIVRDDSAPLETPLRRMGISNTNQDVELAKKRLLSMPEVKESYRRRTNGVPPARMTAGKAFQLQIESEIQAQPNGDKSLRYFVDAPDQVSREVASFVSELSNQQGGYHSTNEAFARISKELESSSLGHRDRRNSTLPSFNRGDMIVPNTSMYANAFSLDKALQGKRKASALRKQIQGKYQDSVFAGAEGAALETQVNRLTKDVLASMKDYTFKHSFEKIGNEIYCEDTKKSYIEGDFYRSDEYRLLIREVHSKANLPDTPEAKALIEELTGMMF